MRVSFLAQGIDPDPLVGFEILTDRVRVRHSVNPMPPFDLKYMYISVLIERLHDGYVS